MSRSLRTCIVVLCGAGALCGPAAAAPATHLERGFLDGGFGATDGAARFAESARLGADADRFLTSWATIAPTQPADPTNPADPAYNWAAVDTMVRSAAAAHVTPLLALTGAPGWAEGADRPASAPPGTWKPNADAYGSFARAIASRYSGRYPDPARPGASLPAVSRFLPWNEPNLNVYLNPQWVQVGGQYQMASPVIYRALLRAFYDGIHAVQPAATVVGGATAPFGDAQPGGARIMPAAFVRSLLCLSRSLQRAACPGPAPRLDALAHHPYTVAGPFQPAVNRDDVSVPDIAARLIKPLRRAESLGILGAGRPRPVWVTEFGWDSNPPDPQGIPAARQAQWLSQAFYAFARQGVSAVYWLLVRDQPPVPSYGGSIQSGVLLADGRRKSAAAAYAFPCVAVRAGRHVRVWTVAPTGGRVVLERRAGSRWKALGTRTARRRGDVVSIVTDLPHGAKVRARLGTARSPSVAVVSARPRSES